VVQFVPAMLPDGRVQAKQVQRSQSGFGAQKRAGPPGQEGFAGLAAGPPEKRPRPAGPPPGWVPAGEASGTVKSFHHGKGLGFITCAETDGDVAFFARDLDPQLLPQVEAGVEVAFEIMQLPDGKLRAQGLRLAGLS